MLHSQNRSRRGDARSSLLRLVVLALFCALAYVSMFVFRFKVAFLTFDIKDAIITIGGLLFGPLAAVSMSLVVSVLETFTVSDTGFYGFIMNFASTAAFSGACSLVYRYRKRFSGAVIGLMTAVVTMTSVMLLMNLIITPLYLTGSSAADVAAMIPTLLLPFNLTKAILNAALVLLLYKPVSRALRAAKVLPTSMLYDAAPSPAEGTPEERALHRRMARRNTIIALALGGVLLVGSILAFFLLLDGELHLFQNLFGG